MQNLMELILIILIILLALSLFIAWMYWPELREAQLTARRHKNYDLRLQRIAKDKNASISTPIKSQNDDYSPMFHGF